MLSIYELEVVTNPEVILTKNRIVQKVSEMFGDLNEDYKRLSQPILPPEIGNVNGKISKGENYLGLPYVMLDYPRIFSKHGIFAIRTFFWWGNFFSITLQLSGEYKNDYVEALCKANANGRLDGWYLCVHQNEWHHHFNHDNYKQIYGVAEDGFFNKPFIKIAKKIPLKQWDESTIFLKANFSQLIDILQY